MNKYRRFLPDALIVFLLFAVPLAFLWQQTLGGRTVIPAENLFQWQPYTALADHVGAGPVQNGLVSDLVLQYYTWQKFAQTQISQGQLPMWQPNILAGTPFMGAGQPQTTYPLSLIYWIPPLWLAFGWYMAIHLGIAGLNVYILSRALRLRRAAGVIAALTYQLSGFVLAALVFPTILAVAAWMPLGLAMIEKVTSEPDSGRISTLLRGKTILWMVIGAGGLGMAALAGHVEAMYFTALVTGFYAAWRTLAPSLLPRNDPDEAEKSPLPALDWRGIIARAVCLGVMIALGLGLGAAMIAPVYELAHQSFREGIAELAQVKEWAFPPRQILGFLMPNFYGSPAHHQYFDLFSWRWTPVTVNASGDPISTTEWGIKNYVEGAAYVGILPLVLAVLAVIGWARVRFLKTTSDSASPLAFIVMAALAASFVFGLPTYDLLFNYLPSFNQSHAPFRWVWPLTLCLALLAGYGLHYLAETLDHDPEDRPAPIPPRLISLLGIGGVSAGVLILAGLVVIWAGYGSFASVVERVFTGMALAPNAFPDARAFFSYQAINIGVMAHMIVASGGVILLAHRVGKRFTLPINIPLWQAAAAIIVVTDLFIGSWGLTPSSDPALLAVTPPSIQWLKDQQAAAPTQPFRFMPYLAPGSTKTMNANTGWYVGLEDATGYDSLIPKQYANYMKTVMPQDELTYNRIAPITDSTAAALDSPLLDLLGVKYVVTEKPIDNPRWKLAYQDEAVLIYENTGVMPRVFAMPYKATRGYGINAPYPEDSFASWARLDLRKMVLVGQIVKVNADGTGYEWEPIPTPKELCSSALCVDNCACEIGTSADPTLAAITVYKPGELWVDTDVDVASWLVVTDSYFPGWRAWIKPIGAGADQETEVPIHLVDGNFRGVLLEPGRWTVHMKYSPDTVKFGLLGTMLSGLALIFLLGVWAWPRLYREEGSGSEAKRVAKNALTPILLNLFTKGISFALTFVSLRVLGPAGAGDYTYAVVIWGWFDIFSNFGLNTYLTREVARHKDQASRFVTSTTLLRLGLAVLGIPALAAFIATRQAAGQAAGQPPLNPATITTLWLLYGGLFFSTISTGLTALFYAFEKAEFPAAIQTISAFLTAALGISALLVGFGIVGLAATSIVVNAVTFVILGVLAVRMFSLRPAPAGAMLALREDGGSAWADIRTAIRESWPLMINHLLATLFFRIDVILLEFLKGATVVGWYRVVYTWVDAIGVIPSFFTLSLFPVMSRQAAEDRPALKRAYVLAIKLMTLLSIPTAIFTTLLATTLVGILGGAEYLPNGAIALQIFIWAMIIGWMNSVTQYVIIALDKQRTLTIAFVVGAAFNITANLIFIPLYSFVAASVITIFSEAVLWIVFYLILTREIGTINWSTALWRIAVAGIVSAGAAFGLGLTISPWLGLVVGGVSYGLMLLLIRPLNAEESSLFTGLLPEGIRRRVGGKSQEAKKEPQSASEGIQRGKKIANRD